MLQLTILEVCIYETHTVYKDILTVIGIYQCRNNFFLHTTICTKINIKITRDKK